MKKTVFVGINAKYVHSNIAVRYLAKVTDSSIIKEYSINERADAIVSDLYLLNPDILFFSCYIWNMELVFMLTKMLKQVLPDTVIVLGGPEVSYDAEDILDKHNEIDYIVSGEGETVVPKLSEAIYDGVLPDLDGVSYKGHVDLKFNITDVCDIPVPYTKDDINELNGKIIYYETQRGCPFRCSYCLSGADGKVRFLPLDTVFSQIDLFCENNVKLVKLVDRTFNADRDRAVEIIKYIKQKSKGTRFHFEVTAELVSDEFILELAEKPDLFQLEIGIQTTNEKTLEAICRKNNFGTIARTVKKLKNAGIHVHLDAICGLPYEDYERFKKTFNDIYQLGGDEFQLGFLKLLKGSKIRSQTDEFGYIASPFAPYEIMANDFITYDEIIKLKYVEDALERYYNSGAFKNTLRYLEGNCDSCFDIYEKLSENLSGSVSKRNLYLRVLDKFGQDSVLKECLAFDYSLCEKGTLYDNMDGIDFKRLCHTLLHNEEFVQKYLPEFVKDGARDIVKRVRFSVYNARVWDDFGEEKTLVCVWGTKAVTIPYKEVEKYV